MDGWIEDVGAWFEDKHYMVCSSLLEGHPIGLMEAMACGLKPVIHNFVGARDIYPEKYIWNTIPEFSQRITNDDYSSIEYKNYIERHYSLSRQLYSIENVISNAPIKTKRKNPSNLKINKKAASKANNDSIYKSVSPDCPKEVKVTDGEIRDWYNKFLGNLKIDHERQNPRHQQIKQTLKKIIKSGMNVLDIGCGTGISSKYMGELGAEVIGVDISDELIKFAMNESAHQNVKYIVEDATQINLQISFDAITIIDSMEHIPRDKIDDFVTTIYRHASKKSIIYLNIPDGRYQRYIKMNHPEKHQIVDEDYDPNILISMFQKIGFQPYHVSIYGLDVPIQYNEYLFMTDYALGNIYKQSFERMRH
jgi:SAM-dependent methyltransferase